MARPQAVFLASVIALFALFVLSLLAVAGVDASPSHRESVAVPLLSAPVQSDPLSIDQIIAAQTPLTCTYTITTPASDVTNNFSFTTAANLAPYNNLTLLPSSAPPPLTTTVQTQYFRVDALSGFHYLVSAAPNSLSTYNLNIIVYN